jgi:hypothetical protein
MDSDWDPGPDLMLLSGRQPTWSRTNAGIRPETVKLRSGTTNT